MDLLVSIFNTILEMSILSSILIIILFLIRLLFRDNLSPKIYYLLWLLILLKFIFPIQIGSRLSLENVIFPMENNQNVSTEFTRSSRDAMEDKVNDSLEMQNGEFVDKPFMQSVASTKKYDDFFNIAAVIWLFGTVIVMLIPTISYIVIKQELKTATHVNDTFILNTLTKIRIKLDISSPIHVINSDISRTPALIGIITPTIILPHNMAALTDDDLYAVLLHECIHFKKKHLYMQWLFWIAKSITWFNPLMWIAHTYMKQDAEYWCDREVLHYINEWEPNTYGHLILDLAVPTKDTIFDITVTGFGNRKTEIKKRLLKIMSTHKQSKLALLFIVCLTLIIIPLFFTSRLTVTDKKKLIDKDIVYALELDEKQTVDSALTVVPTKYVYNEKKQSLKVYFDYVLSDYGTINDQFDTINIHAKLEFPGSVDPEIRQKSITGKLIASTSNEQQKHFELENYDESIHGMAKLIVEGARIEFTPESNQLHDISKEDIPYTIHWENLATATVTHLAINENDNTVQYTLKVKSLTGILTEPYVTCKVDNKRLSSSSSNIDHDGEYVIINTKSRFNDAIFENESVTMEIHSISLVINRFSDRDAMYWRFDIQSQ